MKLNDLERKFFERLVDAELNVPVQATLKYEDDAFDVVVVPEITENNYFALKYYGFPPYEPETQYTEDGVAVKTWTGPQMFGSHPSLQRAWLKGDPVTIQMHRSQLLPFNSSFSPELRAKVHYAGTQHSGTLVLHKGQVVLQDSLLRKTEFCVVGLPDFMSAGISWGAIAAMTVEERDFLESIATKYEDSATVNIRPSPAHVTLDSGNGWNIRLSKDEQQTRDMISHTGLIEKYDNAIYSADELGDILEGLKYFLAFVAGAYRHPTVIIGYDAQNQLTWGEVGQFQVAQNSIPNWFSNSSNPRLGTVLEGLFSCFWDSWMRHKDEIIAVIQSYVHSNQMRKAGVPQDAVAKSFAGLEILGSLELRKTIDGNASEEIARVLSKYEVPHLRLDRAKTPTMWRLSKNLGEDEFRGVHLLGNVRNYVTHPLDRNRPAEIKSKYREFLDSSPLHYFYLHDLSQFYLEYALLRFFGYEASGGYRQLREAVQQG